MAALGPIVDGMSIVASRSHSKSMFDVPDGLILQLADFTASAKGRLNAAFSTNVHVTEHGRVGLCETTRGQFDQHCYHAHRLLFPTDAVDFVSCLAESIVEPIVAASFDEARTLGGHFSEYLYYEEPSGRVHLGLNDESTPRQFFRGIVADAIGQPALRSWRAHPRSEMTSAAAARLNR